ncbi:LacI family DNA-binding transcriptional regulator [Pseudolysinimonas sp.]|uniref:LacI family DNA-binding transcriptional regulator n=1 Tax=Pseudolysinimonas sp. TaxID=2680009 RepID=UPI003F807884
MPRATLHDVAEAAGVSLASASRALSGGSASMKMIRKVRAAARDLNYLADSTARALRAGGATRRVAFAVDDIGNPNYVAMLRAVERTFGADGPRVSVTSTSEPGRTAEWVRQLSLGGADGLILSSLRSDDVLRRAVVNSAIPVVVIGSLGDGLTIDNVRVDSSVAVEQATAHLHALGRRNFAFVNGPLDTQPGSVRERGFYRSTRRLGIPDAHASQIIASEFTLEAGRAAAAPIFSRWHRQRRHERVDAVVAANDLIALGVIVAAHDAGLRVPDDLAVTGIDDIEFAAMYSPSLTSVSMFAARRGEIAADLLLRRFDEPTRPFQTVEVQPELVVRDSTAGSLSGRRAG